MASRLIAVRGELQREGLVIHVIARSFVDFSPDLMRLVDKDAEGIGNAGLARADEVRKGSRPDPRDEEVQKRMERDRQARIILPRGRNFH
jgi:error-prone DNA polymerase